jgi:2,4-dienoyl-CoA reductase (NADPH2)
MPAALSPGAIGRLRLPHRVVMGSMHLGLEDRDDGGAAMAAFYAARARGGAGLIVTGGWAVSREGAGGPHYGLINEPASHERLARVVRAVHDAGGLLALQLFHAGRYAFASSFGLQPVAPSALPSRFSPDPPRALTDVDIHRTIDDFARAAAAAASLGFDAVELMGSEGYLLNQFASPLTNQREDDWGGDEAGRQRFPVEVVRAVRAAAGHGFPVIYRMSGADLMARSSTPAQVRALARALADAGVAGLNVGVGWHEARVPTVQGVVPTGAWVPQAAAVKQAVGTLPVITSNRVNRLEQAEAILASGAVDFVSMARPFLADPEFVARSRQHRRVNVCIACNQACIDRSLVDEPVSCLVNPAAGREFDLGLHGPDGAHGQGRSDRPATVGAGSARRFAVVGGGPAGLSAARTLALAGQQVVVFEAAAELGGQFRLARMVPGKGDYGQTILFYADELSRHGVDVCLGRALAADDVDMLAGFDGIVVATGVHPREVTLPGRELPHVLTYQQAFAALAGEPVAAPEHVRIGARVAVIGGGGIAVDLAHLLTVPPVTGSDLDRFRAEYGLSSPDATTPADTPPDPPAQRAVTVMRRTGRVGAGIGRSTRWVWINELRRRGVSMRTDLTYESITADGVWIRTEAGRELVPADTVVVAAGQVTHDPLGAALSARGVAVRTVGGARSAVAINAVRAFDEGMLAARELLGIDARSGLLDAAAAR